MPTIKTGNRSMANPCICHKKKLIFVHIPKNAGSAIKKSLFLSRYPGKNFGGHFPIFDIDIKDYTIVACCRNPYDRIQSSYHYFLSGRMKGMELRNNIDVKHSLEISKNVDDFIRNYFLEKRKAPVHPHLLPQTYWITKNNDIIVDKLIRFENLEFDYYNMVDELSIEVDKLDIVNKSENKNINLNENSIKIINKFYEQDFDKLGYKKL